MVKGFSFVTNPGVSFVFGVCFSVYFFYLMYHRMFAVCSSSVALLEIVASQCSLPSHSYVREVGGDGSILGGVELEVRVLEGAKPARLFFLGLCVCRFPLSL